MKWSDYDDQRIYGVCLVGFAVLGAGIGFFSHNVGPGLVIGIVVAVVVAELLKRQKRARRARARSEAGIDDAGDRSTE